MKIQKSRKQNLFSHLPEEGLLNMVRKVKIEMENLQTELADFLDF